MNNLEDIRNEKRKYLKIMAALVGAMTIGVAGKKVNDLIKFDAQVDHLNNYCALNDVFGPRHQEFTINHDGDSNTKARYYAEDQKLTIAQTFEDDYGTFYIIKDYDMRPNYSSNDEMAFTRKVTGYKNDNTVTILTYAEELNDMYYAKAGYTLEGQYAQKTIQVDKKLKRTLK